MTPEERLIEEIYHALGCHVQTDLQNNEILDAKFTVNHLINKIEMYYRSIEESPK